MRNFHSIVRAVHVKTGSSSEYIVPRGDSPRVGDFIITSARGAQAGRVPTGGLAEIVEVGSFARYASTRRQYVALVSSGTVRRRNEENDQLSVRNHRRQQALQRLAEKARSFDDMAMYERMAQTDEEAAELLRIVRGDAE